MNEALEYFKNNELAASTWLSKYAIEGEKTPDDMHRRMAKEFARIEFAYNKSSKVRYAPDDIRYKETKDLSLIEEEIYNLFKDFKYIIPGGSVMESLGTNNPLSLSNCFVIASSEDSYAGIMKTRTDQTQLMKRRGGVGHDLSELRPAGAIVHNAARTSTGAASFMEGFSFQTNEVAQNGRRKMFLN